MMLSEDLDPQMAGLAAGASVLGKLSGPSSTPVGIGSILGQLGGAMYGAQQNAVLQREKLANDRMLREAQQAELQQKLVERQDKALKLHKFNSILGQSENPQDPVTILGAGVQSGAFGPQEITSFMGNVMQKQAKIEADIERERVRLADKALAREERDAAEKRMAELRATLQQDNIRLAASLRPAPAQEPLKTVMKDGKVIYVPASQAIGAEVPPSNTNRPMPSSAIKDLADKGESVTTFNRLVDTWQDKFGGKRIGVVGEAQNLVGRNLGAGYGDQANWWQDYQMQKNIIRNKLFGSALTQTEKIEFDKAVITPGMEPEIIRKNLGRQRDAAVRAAKRLSKAYKAGGYSDEQIDEALGLPPGALDGGGGQKDPWE